MSFEDDQADEALTKAAAEFNATAAQLDNSGMDALSAARASIAAAKAVLLDPNCSIESKTKAEYLLDLGVDEIAARLDIILSGGLTK